MTLHALALEHMYVYCTLIGISIPAQVCTNLLRTNSFITSLCGITKTVY